LKPELSADANGAVAVVRSTPSGALRYVTCSPSGVWSSFNPLRPDEADITTNPIQLTTFSNDRARVAYKGSADGQLDTT
jgi:hypothetical protein